MGLDLAISLVFIEETKEDTIITSFVWCPLACAVADWKRIKNTLSQQFLLEMAVCFSQHTRKCLLDVCFLGLCCLSSCSFPVIKLRLLCLLIHKHHEIQNTELKHSSEHGKVNMT
jgi:hypothetical protein